MNDDLLREIAEIKGEIKVLNDRLERVMDRVLLEDMGEKINLEKGDTVLNSQPVPQPIPQPIPQQQFTPILQGKPVKVKSNFETNIGKNVMGILASLLIFVGIVSFVGLVFNNLSEVAKICLMYLFSFGLFGLGIWCLSKKRSAFSLSLSGCGIGAVFLSILLSCFYFEIITNPLVLFGLLVTWSAIVLVLSRVYKSDLFVVISYIGYYIALLLGMFSDIELFGGKMGTVAVMLILHSVFVFLISKEYIPVSDRLYKVFSFVSLLGSFIMTCGVLSTDCMFLSIFNIESLVLILSVMLQMGCNLFYIYKLEGRKIGQVFLTILLLLTCFVNLLAFYGASDNYYTTTNRTSEPLFRSFVETETEDGNFYDLIYDYNEETGYLEIQDDNWMGIFVLFASLVQFAFIEWSNIKYRFSKCRSICLYFLTFVIGFVISSGAYFEVIAALLGLSLPAAILLIYGKDDKPIFRMSVLMYIMGLFIGCLRYDLLYLETYNWQYWVFAISNILYIGLAGYILRNNYSLSNKVWYYIISVFGLIFITSIFGDYYSTLLADNYLAVLEQGVPIEGYEFTDNLWYSFLNFDLASVVVYLTISIYGLFVKLTSFGQDWDSVNGLKKSQGVPLDVVYNLNNGLTCLLLFAGISFIHNVEIGWIKFILILLASLQCFIGSRELLSRGNRVLEYYVWLKATFFINSILGVFVDGEMGYIYSIVCLWIAVTSIASGFKIDLKSFRLYGLLLSIFSILKLLLVDIQYDNSMVRIVSFIGAGLLCFFIVWIYNKMSEKLKE